VLVVYADSPLLTTESLNRLVQACRRAKAAVGVLGFRARNPSPYGRLIVTGDELEKIVESKDANPAEKAIDFVNSGVMCLDGSLIAELVEAIRNDNVKGEFYLTDAVGIARAKGHRAIAVQGMEEEFQGVNSRGELAVAERTFQNRLRAAAMAAGVTMADPDTVWLSADTRFSPDVTLGPNVRFGPGVTVASNVRINAFCDIEGAKIGKEEVLREIATSVGLDADAVAAEVASGRPLKILADEHTEADRRWKVFGVPTFIVGERAAFVRVMDRNNPTDVDRVLDLLEWTDLNEFKHTSVPR